MGGFRNPEGARRMNRQDLGEAIAYAAFVVSFLILFFLLLPGSAWHL